MTIQLVIEYESGDGYTYSSTTAFPIEYASAEAFIVDLEEGCRLNRDTTGEYMIAGHTFYCSTFFETLSEWREKKKQKPAFYPPLIMTIPEWFAYHNPKPKPI